MAEDDTPFQAEALIAAPSEDTGKLLNPGWDRRACTGSAAASILIGAAGLMIADREARRRRGEGDGDREAAVDAILAGWRRILSRRTGGLAASDSSRRRRASEEDLIDASFSILIDTDHAES